MSNLEGFSAKVYIWDIQIIAPSGLYVLFQNYCTL